MALESNIYALWASKQAAKGTANTAGTKRLIQVAGDVDTQPADGSEAFSDLDRFGNQTDFRNTIMGAGSPGIEGQSDVLAYLCWLFFGGEVFTAGTNPVHTLTKGTATGGTFDLTIGVGGASSTAVQIPIAQTAALLQTTLNALPNVAAAGGVTCAGGPLGTTPITITFNNASPLGSTAFVTSSDPTTPLTGGTAPTDVVTTPGVMATKVFTPQVAGGFWSTWQKRLGQTVIVRQQHVDARMNSFAIEGSTASKVLRITPSLVTLNPGVTYATDPTSTINLANVPFLYTDGTGTFTIDGQVFTGQTQFNITWDEGLAPVYGDRITPLDFVPALARITVAATVIVDSTGITEYNKLVYGTSSPTAGTQPIQGLPALGSWACNMTKPTGEACAIAIPGVHWNPGMALAPNPQGGVIDLSLAGEMRKLQGTPASTVTVHCPDNAAYTT